MSDGAVGLVELAGHVAAVLETEALVVRAQRQIVSGGVETQPSAARRGHLATGKRSVNGSNIEEASCQYPFVSEGDAHWVGAPGPHPGSQRTAAGAVPGHLDLAAV